MKHSMDAQRVLIKKYENRRLYDATNSRYVNLDEVAQLVQQGYDVQVIDAASGDDITRLTLTQIIAEGAKTSDSNFPVDILRQMVIASGRASQESAVRYTKAMLDLYQSAYRAMAPALNPFEYLRDPLGVSAVPAQPAEQPTPGSDSGSRNDAQATDELSELKQRLAHLEKTLSALAPKPSAPAQKKKRPSPARRPGTRKHR